MDDDVTLDTLVDDAVVTAKVGALARLCHEVNRAYCEATGDDSQIPWDEAPDWQRESAVDGVQFLLGDPAAGPEQSHERWMAQKTADGWRHGEVKDAQAKTHPALVAYGDLPVVQRVKDALFEVVVRAGDLALDEVLIEALRRMPPPQGTPDDVRPADVAPTRAVGRVGARGRVA